MNQRDEQILRHMLGHCKDISDFIQRFGTDYAVFTQDRAYFNAVAMCVMQIGALSNGLSEEYRESTKDQMPWGMIRGMRNWLAHSYAAIDAKVLGKRPGMTFLRFAPSANANCASNHIVSRETIC